MNTDPKTDGDNGGITGVWIEEGVIEREMRDAFFRMKLNSVKSVPLSANIEKSELCGQKITSSLCCMQSCFMENAVERLSHTKDNGRAAFEGSRVAINILYLAFQKSSNACAYNDLLNAAAFCLAAAERIR